MLLILLAGLVGVPARLHVFGRGGARLIG